MHSLLQNHKTGEDSSRKSSRWKLQACKEIVETLRAACDDALASIRSFPCLRLPINAIAQRYISNFTVSEHPSTMLTLKPYCRDVLSTNCTSELRMLTPQLPHMRPSSPQPDIRRRRNFVRCALLELPMDPDGPLNVMSTPICWKELGACRRYKGKQRPP